MLTMSLTAGLGLWQLDRAGQKEKLQAEIDAAINLPVWTERDLLIAQRPELGVYRKVKLSGQWVSDATIFLDNRQMGGRSGFFVVTPLRLLGSERAILIQRGWTPRDFTDRYRVPKISTPSGQVFIEGLLAPAPAKLLNLGADAPGPIRQNIDPVLFAQERDIPLFNLSILQTNLQTNDLKVDLLDGLDRNWPRVEVGLHKHYGYAFQWFALCILSGVLYAWLAVFRPRRKHLINENKG